MIVPVPADICSGVFPFDMGKLTSAPDLISICVHRSPRLSSMREAMCNAVSPIVPPNFVRILYLHQVVVISIKKVLHFVLK